MSNKLKQAALNYQKKYILKALRANHGNVTVTAKRLGVHRNTIILKINGLGIKKEYKSIKREISFKPNPGIITSENNKLREATYRFERSYLKKLIRKADDNITKTSKMIGVHRNTIILKVVEYKLKDYIENKRWEKRHKNKVLMRYHTIIKPKMQAGCIDTKSRLIGKRIKKARRKMGFNQNQLAAKSGVYQTYICQAERGMKELRSDDIKRIEKALKISLKSVKKG